ncbi:MAG: hypothetical protein BWY75_03875 [bacterium ADurb.Bin425]|nr:MAG: hypothetical protein BWY75_03875 [bacterium ADurb.Bin425]
MGINLLGQRNSCRHQEGYPVDRVELGDVFADEMEVCRPVLLEVLAVGEITRPGDVIGEGIHPNINDLVVIAWNIDAPIKRFARTRD